MKGTSEILCGAKEHERQKKLYASLRGKRAREKREERGENWGRTEEEIDQGESQEGTIRGDKAVKMQAIRILKSRKGGGKGVEEMFSRETKKDSRSFTRGVDRLVESGGVGDFQNGQAKKN